MDQIQAGSIRQSFQRLGMNTTGILHMCVCLSSGVALLLNVPTVNCTLGLYKYRKEQQ